MTPAYFMKRLGMSGEMTQWKAGCKTVLEVFMLYWGVWYSVRDNLSYSKKRSEPQSSPLL